MRRFALVLLAFAGLATPQAGFAQAAPDPVGDWHGALQTPQGAITLAVTVSRAPDGSLKATVENTDQGPGNKVPMSSVGVQDGTFAFEVAQVGASFKGSWVPAEQSWNGIFKQGVELPLKLIKGPPPARPVVAGLDGTWSGTITRNAATLRLILHIRTTPQGTIILLDSPDQMANGVPVQGLTREGQKVSFKLAVNGASYAGLLSADAMHIAGIWTVPNRPDAPVDFTRSQGTSALVPPKRPQTPQPPFPYTAEDVSFDNSVESGVHLAGTLTLPPGKGPFPAAILITGSGPQDRDETLLGHKPFWVIADYLSRRGIAVLRVDDRGTAKSTGDFAKATSADFATDANAAFAFLKTRKDIRPNAIGFIGHSEGGMVGPIAMATNKQVAFLVMMAGPGTALDQLMLSQRRLIGAAMGQSEAEMNRTEPVMAALFKAVASGATSADGLAAARAVLTPEAMSALGLPPTASKEIIIAQISTPWFRYFLRYDPAPNLRAIRVPVLAMNGSLDRQVPPAANLAAIRAALKDDKDVTIVELPGLNHLFQTAKTGAVGEYAEIEETVAPIALDRMATWIDAHFGARK
ncbi:MAG TPA: alpha/beta hydrolase [Sphingomonas sp.]|uniref:prolyl oligopeptidase family serine peptidase n=1 Tax=Sphingomonas sp. TaxID=28214 RepID=UPI002C558EF5|nr:alpha/beta hydrolase [Sphingomonas sp.]HMI19340.1 alpha/beta hydrolase [Sphingomonas sp.]